MGKSLYFKPMADLHQLSESKRQAYTMAIISVILGAYLPGNHLLSTRGVACFMLRAIEHLEREYVRPAKFDEIRYYFEDYRAIGFEKDWMVTRHSALFKLTTGPVGRLFNCH